MQFLVSSSDSIELRKYSRVLRKEILHSNQRTSMIQALTTGIQGWYYHGGSQITFIYTQSSKSTYKVTGIQFNIHTCIRILFGFTLLQRCVLALCTRYFENKNNKHIFQVGLEPTTFAILEQYLTNQFDLQDSPESYILATGTALI